MYIEIDETDANIIKRIANGLSKKNNVCIFNDRYLIDKDDLISLIEDVYGEWEEAVEAIEKIEQDKLDNWKRVSVSEQVGIPEYGEI